MKLETQGSTIMIKDLSEKVKNLPLSPGVYIFKNNRGIPIYIGKAGNIRARVKTYFRKEYRVSAARKYILKEIADIEIIKTESEIEALVLESQRIKTSKPRYNILMRDDKQYFYVGFTNEQFPKIFLTHQPKTKIFFIGPFVSGQSLRIALRTLRRVFPYCTCKRLHKSDKACLNYNIGIDLGGCCVKNPKSKTQNPKLQQKIKNYKHNIENIKKILRGQKVRVVNELEKEMRRAAERQNFEEAAKLRDQLEGIQKILAHKKIIQNETEKIKNVLHAASYILHKINRIEGYDISNIQGQFAVGSMVVFARDENGNFVPQKNRYRKFKIKTIKGANDTAMLKEVIQRRLTHAEWKLPGLFLIDGGIPQRNAASAVSKMNHTAVRVWGLAKREEELYTEKGVVSLSSLPFNEAKIIAAVRDEAHRFAIGYYRKLHRKDLVSNLSQHYHS